MSCLHHLSFTVSEKMLFINGDGSCVGDYSFCAMFYTLSRSTLTNEVLLSSPHDVTLKSQKQANQLAYELNNRNVEHYYNYKEVVYAHLYKDHMFTEGISRPSVIAVTSDKYIPNVNIGSGQTDIIVPRGSIKDVVKVDRKGSTLIGTKIIMLK